MNFMYYGSERDKEKQMQKLSELPGIVSVDVETVDLEGEAIGLAIAGNPNEAFYFPIYSNLWRGILDKRISVFHNAHFDIKKLKFTSEFEDTFLIYRALGEEYASLKALAWDKCMIEFPTAKELMAKYKTKRMDTIPIEEVAVMCCQHAMATIALWEAIPNIPQVYYTIDKPMINVLVDMETRGVYIDKVELNSQLERQRAIVEERRAAFTTVYGSINMNSPKQLKIALGTENTNKETLKRLGDYASQMLLEYRKATKAVNTYLLPFSNTDAEGRIHSKFGYTRTARLRSEDPNLQNLTKGELRRIVSVSEGKLFIDIDYDQLELRVLAFVSQDKAMIDAFARGEDLHQKTADAVCRGDRELGKLVNFAASYGASEWKIAELASCTLEEGLAIKKGYFKLYPGYADYVKQTRRFARHNYYVETIFGRRRKMWELSAGGFGTREKGLREAVNTVVQSPSADIVKLAMLDLQDLPLVMQVHDELIYEMDNTDSVERIEKACCLAYPLLPELKVHTKIGKNYDFN